MPSFVNQRWRRRYRGSRIGVLDDKLAGLGKIIQNETTAGSVLHDPGRLRTHGRLSRRRERRELRRSLPRLPHPPRPRSDTSKIDVNSSKERFDGVHADAVGTVVGAPVS